MRPWTRRFGGWVLLCLWLPLSALASTASGGVLVLASYGFGRSGADLYLQSFTAELTRLGVPAQDMHVEYLDSQWGRHSGAERHKRAALLDAYAPAPPAVVVTLQQPALDFALRELLPRWHGAALLAVQGQLPDAVDVGARLPTRTLQQAASLDLHNGLLQVLQLFPKTRHVLMLAGTDPQDQATKSAMVRASAPFADRLTVEYTDTLTRADTLKRVETLPRHSIVFHGNVNQDASGARLTPNELNREVTERANAPVFALVRDMLGTGVVGGSLLDPAHEARRAAKRVHGLVGGAAPWPGGVQTLATQAVAAYDWRALDRWRAAMDALPADAVLVHRPASLWRDNRATVLGTLAVLSGLLVSLLALWRQNRQRLRAQALAQASEARWRELFEHAPDAILLHEPQEDRIVAANPAALRLFACSAEALLQRTASSFECLPSDGAALQAASPDPTMTEVSIRDAAGQERRCVLRRTLLPHGSRRLWRSSYLDITERARQREALRVSEERWKFALEGAGQGVWDHDLVGDQAFHSPRLLQILGYGEGGLPRRVDGWHELVHPDELGEALSRSRACHRGDCDEFVCDMRMRCGDGIWRWMEVRGMVVARDGQGRALRTVGTVADIHDRKEAEDALEVAALLYRHAAEGMMVSDEGANILAVNDAFLHMLGYTREEVVGQKSYRFRATRAEEDNRHQLWTLLQREGHWRGELLLRHKSGQELPFMFSINAIAATPLTPRRYVSLFSDNAEQRRHEQRLWHEAHHDALTGLPNRRHVLQRLERAAAQGHAGDQVALVVIDLDRFKPVNDSFGPQAGDALLREVAGRIALLARDGDVLARMGADEFVLMLTGVQGEAQAADLARRVIECVRPVLNVADRQHHMTASAGVALAPLHAQGADDLIRRAGQALSEAKRDGGDTVRLFRPDLELQMQYRMRVATDLRSAVQRGEFEVHYQPIVDLQTGAVRKAEALVRWCHPDHPGIGPATFIPIAEEAGLIEDIGNWVFMQATAEIGRWRQVHDGDFQISINKSPMQFTPRHTRRSLWPERLSALGLPGQCVVAEITEGLLLDQRVDVAEQIALLSACGVALSIDDFGTGYSSLAYVQKFPVRFLKIDRSFVRFMEDKPRDLALCEAIVAMAHKLGLQVIAEGVETQRQCDLLKAMGCDYGQGYLFARPLPLAAFDDWLAERRAAVQVVG